MSLVFRCLKANCAIISVGAPLPQTCFNRSFSDEKSKDETQYSSSTIFIENGLNVHELPLVVRRLKQISEVDDTLATEPLKTTTDSLNYHMIQEEFKQCIDLREVFALLTKCTKITPNIALGAMERIYDLEKSPTLLSINNKTMHVNLAKGAILDKLIRVVMKTEDTQTILNILNTVSSFMELYKPKFSDEILLRVIDNKLSIEQLCIFMEFLIKNKSESQYSATIDKLWVGFFERENEIDEHNIGKVFNVLHGLKSSKKTILALLEQKFSDLWFKINVNVMSDILETFVQQKYLSAQSFVVVGTWLYSNIHAIDQDSLLDIISKLTRLNYTDQQVEKAVEKYMKLKGSKINSHVLVVGILNYCLHFKIRNDIILNVSSEYFMMNYQKVPNIFLKSMIYPFGYLNFDPKQSQFWTLVETILDKNFDKFGTDDICSILLSFIYVEKYPLKLANRLFTSENLIKMSNTESVKTLHLIDTALSLESSDYHGPLLPKDQWTKDVPQDPRIKNIIKKTEEIFSSVAGGPYKLSTAVMVPHIYSDSTYLIDVLIHPAGLVNNTSWKAQSVRNENIAVLIHLPDHYCSDYEHLVGHQAMRKRHLKILGMKVVSLKYTVLSNFYTSCNSNGLRQYLEDSLNNAEECTNM